MLLTSPVGCPPAFLSGLGVTAEEATRLAQQAQRVIELQKALKQLSIAARNPAIDPGPVGLVSGLPSDQTMSAVVASMSLIGPKLPTWARAALVIGLSVGAASSTAKKAVMDYADELRKAAIAATVAAPFYVQPEAAPAAPEAMSIFATTGPWYKTWWGIGALAVGALGMLSLVAASRRA